MLSITTAFFAMGACLMPSPQVFGGSWTETKLKILQGYLKAYSTIFTANEKARFFNTFYVDAFAGSGYIKTGDRSLINEPELFGGFEEVESQEFLKGSSICALEVDPPFKNYLFIERAPARCLELEKLKTQFPKKASSIRIRQGDANESLVSWIASQNWNKTRAVVFLDPYGMQVEWETLKALGQTCGVDLWLLFPLGVGVEQAVVLPAAIRVSRHRPGQRRIGSPGTTPPASPACPGLAPVRSSCGRPVRPGSSPGRTSWMPGCVNRC